MSTVYDYSAKSLDGRDVSLDAYRGKVLLIVNTASQCGFTPQYAGLEKLYEKYKGQGFVIIGVPANNFGGQEPGTNEEIKTFCDRTYHVTFPIMSKVSVKGADMIPLYQYLTSQTGGEIKWNFTKILVGKDGVIAKRFESPVTPESADLVKAVETALAK